MRAGEPTGEVARPARGPACLVRIGGPDPISVTPMSYTYGQQ